MLNKVNEKVKQELANNSKSLKQKWIPTFARMTEFDKFINEQTNEETSFF